jgi:hypothetical protein
MGVENFKNKEHVLNFTAQRFQLTRPKAVGPTMDLIHKCKPKSKSEWQDYYWKNAYTATKVPIKITKQILDELGERLYIKITEVVIPEWTKAFDEITLDDCKNYILDVTLDRTYDGYHRESAVFRELAVKFDGIINFEKTESETDSALDVDYIGVVRNSYRTLGIQVKPISARGSQGGYSITDRVRNNFRRFEEDNNAKVFIVLVKREGKKSVIVNREVIQEIESYVESGNHQTSP